MTFDSEEFKSCFYREQHRYFVRICNRFPYNTMLHERNCFSATNCFCIAEGKNSFCTEKIVLHLFEKSTEWKSYKNFLESDIEKCDFEVLPIKT